MPKRAEARPNLHGIKVCCRCAALVIFYPLGNIHSVLTYLALPHLVARKEKVNDKGC
jgi:hypothetical protein